MRADHRMRAILVRGRAVERAIPATIRDRPVSGASRPHRDFGGVTVVDCGNRIPMLRRLDASPGRP
ncbi:MAG: hypothetical protein ACM3NF_09170 [Gemmatimonadota bacterium]